MKRKARSILGAGVLLLTIGTSVFCQRSYSHQDAAQPLQNRDVLLMVKRGMKADAIVARITTSRCNFDIFPPALEDLRRRGVPETVLRIMTAVPNGPAALSEPEGNKMPITAKVKLPRGLGISIESLYPVSSANAKEGSTIKFAVVSPIYVDGVLTIVRGAIATARVVRVRKAGMLGRGGVLTCKLENIIAVDGTKIPAQLTTSADGSNRAAQVAAGAALTSALVFPYTAPAAIFWGFKKGDDAVLRGSKRFTAVIADDVEILGIIPDKDKVIYHTADALKAKTSNSAAPTAFPRMAIRN